MDINKEFDNKYIISLKGRLDRRERTIQELSKINLTGYQFWDAVDGSKEEFEWDDSVNIIGWTKGAAALALSTIGVIEDAKKNGYEKILIMEDDVMFIDIAKEYIEDLKIPDGASWDMFFFGYLERRKSFPISNKITRLRSAFCCHCYAISSRVYDDYLFFLRMMNKPIDWITSDNFHPMGRCLATRTSIAHQKPDYSNIRNEMVHNMVTI